MTTEELIKCKTVSEVARAIDAKPRDISDLFYRRVLNDEFCPVMAGRRLIPPDYLEQVVWALHKHGMAFNKIKAEAIGARIPRHRK